MWAHSLKGNHPEAWEQIAEVTINAMATGGVFQNLTPGRTLIVVDPSQKMDHSYWYAHHLARRLNAQHLPFFFVKNSEQKQKELNRFHRYGRELQYRLANKDQIHLLHGEFTTTWLFVDDVITSGATATSLYTLLGCPRHFIALSWLRREATSSMISI